MTIKVDGQYSYHRTDSIKKDLKEAIEKIRTINAPTIEDAEFLDSITTLINMSIGGLNAIKADEKSREYWKGYDK
jgi:hypothetical protein